MLERARSKNFILSKRFNTIMVNLSSTYVFIDYKSLPLPMLGPLPLDNGPRITLESTLSLITNTLRPLEAELRVLLDGIANECFYLCYRREQLITYTRISQSLRNIAPRGLVAVVPDYYYVIQLLLDPEFAAKIFNPTQLHQWNSYETEFLENET